MRNITKILLLLIILASLIEAKALKSDGWNLMSVCVDINRSDINMTGISQIQSQDGKFIFTGDYASWSDLDVLKAGYGYWVYGSKDTEFNGGEVTSELRIPLPSDGWNLMAMCEDRDASILDMTGISQIQSQDGKFIFTGDYASWSDLNFLESGYGYWVNGSAGLLFSSKKGVSLPQGYDFQMINNQGVYQETILNGYTIKLFVNYDNPADQQQNHKGVKVQINRGELSELLSIQDSYIGKNFVVAIYNSIGELVAVSELMEVTTGTLPILVNIDFDDSNGNGGMENTPLTLNSIPNQIMNEGTSSFVIELNATDAENDTITFDVNSSDSASVTASISGNQLTLTRLTSTGGTVTITVKATDDKGASDVKSFTVTLPNNNTNSPSIGTMPSALITPNGGEVWTYDQNETINWNMSIDGSSINLYVLHDNPDNLKTFSGDVSTLLSSMNWYQIGDNIPNTGSYEVNPRNLNGVGDAYVVLIVSNQSGEWDISDNTFTLVDPSGNGGDTNGTQISEEMMNTFAGKTFYSSYIDENSVGIIEEIIFDENLSSLTWEQVRGGSESGSENIRVEGNQLYMDNEYHEYIEQVDNYLLMHDYEQDANGSWVQRDTTRLYLNFNDAESYLATLNGGNINVSLPDGYIYRAINNLGTEVETAVEIEGNSYTLQLYSNIDVVANDQAHHVGIALNVNDQTALLQIQNSYETHNVVLAVYDVTGQRVAVSAETTVNGNTAISLTF